MIKFLLLLWLDFLHHFEVVFVLIAGKKLLIVLQFAEQVRVYIVAIRSAKHRRRGLQDIELSIFVLDI
jgi:hypothetical protein